MISCILLAAGESTRFPGNKLLFEIKPNLTVLDNILNSVKNSKVDQTILVLGHEANRILQIMQDKLNNTDKIVTTVNSEYQTGGMSSSIRKGIKLALNSQAVLILPADIPLIPSSVFDQIIDHYYTIFPKLIIPTFQKRKGHPILISSELYDYIKSISEEKQGLKEIVRKFWDEITFLPTDSEGILLDIDSISDIPKMRFLHKTINKH
jgi:molybdenum cofactor cytidylyltransferase